MNKGNVIFNADTFRELMSKNLGVELFHRQSAINKMRNLLCNIHGCAKYVLSNDEFFAALEKTLATLGFTIDLESITPMGNDCTSLTAIREEKKLNIGITNSISPPFYIIITIME